MARVGPCTLVPERPPSVFRALAESIAYQQLTGKAAATIFARVTALTGGARRFTARNVLAVGEAPLRGAGLSRAKAAAILDLARHAEDRRIPTLRELEHWPEEAIIEALLPVRGVGRWTVEMFLMFSLGRPDVLPLGDYGVRKGAGRIHGRDAPYTPEELAAAGERWAPYRTVASWYCWRACELE
ncbi:MAG: hypothetical protein NW201_15495 [Gemmatimonadales bacterium]|nr:hypothetical protein [Gemmatimonadales bacterium]